MRAGDQLLGPRCLHISRLLIYALVQPPTQGLNRSLEWTYLSHVHECRRSRNKSDEQAKKQTPRHVREPHDDLFLSHHAGNDDVEFEWPGMHIKNFTPPLCK